MNISIIKKEVETVRFTDIKHGGLFRDPQLDDSPLYLKTIESDSICLLTGDVEDVFSPDYEVIDVTDKYVIVNL